MDTSGQTTIAIQADLEYFRIECVLMGSDYPFGSLEQPPSDAEAIVVA